jgi:uncharacterized damage-inducible protein DinB
MNMPLRQRLKRQLETVRGMSESLLSAFKTPRDWTFQVHPQANHALWFAGHVGTVDNFMISLLAPEKAVEKPGYREKFGMGSRPTADPDAYPPPAEVLAFMRERRQAVLDLLAALEEEDLQRACPKGAPPMMPDMASVFEAAAWHEALHAGQVTVARRALGHPPMVDRPKPDLAGGV